MKPATRLSTQGGRGVGDVVAIALGVAAGVLEGLAPALTLGVGDEDGDADGHLSTRTVFALMSEKYTPPAPGATPWGAFSSAVPAALPSAPPAGPPPATVTTLPPASGTSLSLLLPTSAISKFPALSRRSPDGLLKSAADAAPSSQPEAALPPSVFTAVLENAIKRRRCWSVTYTPEGEAATPRGYVKLAAVPMPSAQDDKPLPARVVVKPEGVMARTR